MSVIKKKDEILWLCSTIDVMTIVKYKLSRVVKISCKVQMVFKDARWMHQVLVNATAGKLEVGSDCQQVGTRICWRFKKRLLLLNNGRL